MAVTGSVMEYIFIKFRLLSYMAVKTSVMESVLVKFQAITMNGNAQVCGRSCDKFGF